MSATIREVARAAGVSVATVSRVVNGKGPVREATRRRVKSAAERLRYAPHGAARSLITNRTSTVGVLLPDIYGEFFSELIRGMDLAARAQEYHILVSGSHDDAEEIEAVLRALRGRVDGLIVMSPMASASALREIVPEGIPVVLLNGPARGTPYTTMRFDNRGGAFAMTRHLLSLGHDRIAILEGPPGNQDARDRLKGWQDAMAEKAGARGVRLPGDFTESSGFAAGQRLYASSRRPTAVFAANDAMAIGCLAAFREAGLGVPADVAVAGFDDIPIARFVTPPLSTVRVSIADLGARAFGRLFDRLSGQDGDAPRHQTLPTRLVIRESCGARPPPGARRRNFREKTIRLKEESR
jgi:LacI family transcriptional regulator